MPAACDIDRRDRAHQLFLRAVGNRFRHLAHVAIQVNLWLAAFHSKINSSDAKSSSCSFNSPSAVPHSTRSNRISSRGRSCPQLGKSAEITLPIFGYPPVLF